MKRVGVCVLALVLIGSACSKSSTPGGAGGKGKTYVVQIDSKKQGQAQNTAALQYFPAELKIHAGDTVRFKLNWSGEPHSATFGSLVDAGFAKIPASPSGDFEDPAEFKKLPEMIPEDLSKAEPVSVNPCFVETGDPTVATCKADQPKFNGKYAVYSSGFIPDGTDFTVATSKDLAAATYNYFCTLHRTEMHGKITVVPDTETVDVPAKVEADANAAIDAYVAKAAPLVDQIKNGMGPGTAFAGMFDDKTGVALDQFGPKELTAKVGQLVKFIPLGFHTVSFNASQDVVGVLLVKGANGWDVNRAAFDPAGGAKPAIPSKETGNIAEGGTWNGEGFFSSGALPGFGPPGFLTFQMKFSKAGTYKFVCVVHPDMEGRVTVS